MTVADTAFVGELGPAALAGVGLGGTLCFAAIVFGMGLLRGVKIVVSQAVGAGHAGAIVSANSGEERSDRIDQVAAAGLIIAIGLGLVVVLVAQILVLAVPAMASSEAAGAIAAEYVWIRLLGAPLLFIFCTTREVSYGVGDSRSPMVASVIANVFNISLDYVFIVQLDYGASGAAWATLIATVVEASLLVTLRRAPGFRSLSLGFAHIAKVMRLGVPTGLQSAVEMGAFTLLTILIAAMPETELAGHQVALCVIHFAFLPMVAVGEAASVMAGQAVGADKDELIPKVAIYAVILGGGYALMCTLILGLGAPTLVSFFGDDVAVRQTATNLLYLAALFQLGDAFNIVGRTVLRGTGDVRIPAIIAVGVSWSALPPLTWFLGHHLEMGALGAWLGITCEIFVVAAILWWRLWSGGWHVSASKSRLCL
jgi:MATE family multidrug resistance protein